jgi:hypothetical protein
MGYATLAARNVKASTGVVGAFNKSKSKKREGSTGGSRDRGCHEEDAWRMMPMGAYFVWGSLD